MLIFSIFIYFSYDFFLVLAAAANVIVTIIAVAVAEITSVIDMINMEAAVAVDIKMIKNVPETIVVAIVHRKDHGLLDFT